MTTTATRLILFAMMALVSVATATNVSRRRRVQEDVRAEIRNEWAAHHAEYAIVTRASKRRCKREHCQSLVTCENAEHQQACSGYEFTAEDVNKDNCICLHYPMSDTVPMLSYVVDNPEKDKADCPEGYIPAGLRRGCSNFLGLEDCSSVDENGDGRACFLRPPTIVDNIPARGAERKKNRKRNRKF